MSGEAGTGSDRSCRGGAEQNFVEAWLEAAEELRGDPLPLPERSGPREVDPT
ncbi:hypothetical protein [Streptomonospora sp. PA3]|uniref:hypothetical protein n=1 Tax=Streptomonospora sp. PA3 TaxID=2607326 RepID=UPI0012DCAA0F|nr:hypothetical protein [Streptomonospora sp. PA3]